MRSAHKIKTRLLLVTVLALFALPSPALAQGIIYGEAIPAGTLVESDVILVGQDVAVDGTVDGNVFILGNQVRVDGKVNGSMVVIGQNVSIGGTVDGGVYALGLTLDLGPAAALERDLYVLSVGLGSAGGSRIQRDLFALGLDAGLNGSVGRDLHTAIGPLQLYNGLMTVLGFEELTLKLRFDLPAPAPESTPAPAATPTSRLSGVARARVAHAATRLEGNFDPTAWALAVLREWIVLAVFGLLAFWAARPRLETASAPLRARPLRVGLSGLLVLVVSLNLFVLAALLGALVFSLGLALNYTGLWQLALVFWAASYSTLVLASAGLWFFIVYLTKIIAVYALSGWLAERLHPAGWVKVLALLAGLLAYALLRSAPIVGWVIGLLTTAAGMGTVWIAYRAAQRPPPLEAPAKPDEQPKKRKAGKA